MEYLTKKKFSFSSSALPPDTFTVVRFRGTETISRPYEFEVLLISGNRELDLESILQHPAKLTIHRDEGDPVHYHGILIHFEQLHEVGEIGFYRAYLVPKLWWLSLTQHNQVFLNRSVPEMVEGCLQDGGLTSLDFEFKLQGAYEPVEYACQYGESHLNFVSRWLEREGIYYYFAQSENGEKVVFTDTAISHTPMPQGRGLYYSPPSGLDALSQGEVVKFLNCRCSLVPSGVFLKDYNDQKPSLEVSGRADVHEKGRGQVYYYGAHILTPEEGNRLAKIRAEAILCRRQIFHGESSVPYVVPGFTFGLERHFRRDFNQDYMTTEVSHEGNQTGFLLAGLSSQLTEGEREIFYRNDFAAIPVSIQFRPEQKALKPRISGTIAAKVDAAGSGKYAEIDEYGRYKVVFPFDLSGRRDGKASAWVRMAQPYAGADHGMHFPLHKGTEVLLTFIDGDPDRPIIAGAVPNLETPSIIGAGNPTGAGFKTAGGSHFSMQDQEGHERISMGSGDGKTRIICGAGSKSKILTQTEFEANCNDYYMTCGAIGGTIANSFSWSAVSGSLIPTVGINLLKRWSQEVAECDELGHRMGAIEKGRHFRDWTSTQEMLLAVVPSVVGVLFDTWILSSLEKQLKEKKLVRKTSEYGKVCEKFEHQWGDKGFWNKCQTAWERTSYLRMVLRAYGLGTTGSYGVFLVSHIPEKIFGKWESYDVLKGLIDPRCASMLKLNKASPDVLIASTAGYVDIMGAKGIHAYTDEDLHIESFKNAVLKAEEFSLAAGPFELTKGVIAINRNKEHKIELEMGQSTVVLDPVKGIDQFTAAEGIHLYVHHVRNPKEILGSLEIKNPNANKPPHYGKEGTEITLENERSFVKLDSLKDQLAIGVRPNDQAEPAAQVKMDLAAKRIEIMGEKAVEIDTPEVKIGQGTKKCQSVNVGNPNATRINFRGTDFTFNGKKIKIG